MKTLLDAAKQYTEFDKFSVNGEFYHIKNVYFDNVNSDMIRLSVGKPKFKEKIRARQYGFDETLPIYLELKKKIQGIVVKRRISISKDDFTKFCIDNTLPEKNKPLNKFICEEIKFCMQKFGKIIPMIQINYDRLALFNKEGQPYLRMTFDKNLKAKRKNIDFKEGEMYYLLDEGTYIVEIKVKDATPLWLTKVLGEHQIYRASYSKYGKEYQNLYLLNDKEN